MTPEEKAKELYMAFRSKFRGRMDNGGDKDDCAKECALIVVQEVLSVNPDNGYYTETEYIAIPQSGYWREVKWEIEKL